MESHVKSERKTKQELSLNLPFLMSFKPSPKIHLGSIHTYCIWKVPEVEKNLMSYRRSDWRFQSKEESSGDIRGS